MKILLLVCTTIILTAGMVVAGVGAALASDGLSSPGAVLLVIGAILLFVPPIVTQSLYWGAGRRGIEQVPARTRRAFLLVSIVGIPVGVVVALLGAALAGVPGWVAPAFVGCAAVAVALTLVFRWTVLRERVDLERDAAEERAWSDLDAAAMRRRWITVVVVFLAAGLAIGITVVVVFSAIGVSEPDEAPSSAEIAGDAVLFGVTFGAFSASLACLLAMRPIPRSILRLDDVDWERKKVVRKVVVQGKDLELSDEERRLAARFALVLRRLQPFQIGQQAFLLSGISLNLIGQLLRLADEPVLVVLTWATAGLLVVGIAVLVPVMVRQYRRIARYSDAHPVDAVG